jgi:formylglycine-generating enzyme required for sulfatase activity
MLEGAISLGSRGVRQPGKTLIGISISLAGLALILLIAFILAKLFDQASAKPPAPRDQADAKNPPRTSPQANAESGALKEFLSSFVSIPAGEFMMGATNGKPDEKPVHRVRLSQPFEMGKYEVTQAVWEALMGSNPSEFRGANLPVENVSWLDAQEFIEKLNARNDDYIYRLPTEAEWEYACRAGSSGNYAGKLDQVAWYDDDSGNTTHPVGKKQPNAWGLYDMHGNVFEWCQDWYDGNYYAESPTVDPQGPQSGSFRVKRGGSWVFPAAFSRSAARDLYSPVYQFNFLGFRVVRTRR